MDSQQYLTESVIRRIEEEARVLRALTTENKSNKTLIKDLQDQLKEAKEKEERQNQIMEEMRKEIALLRNGEESSDTINITVKTLMGTQFTLKMRSHDVVCEMKLKIRELEQFPVHTQRWIFKNRELQDDKTLADSGIVSGSIVYMSLRLGGPGSGRTSE